MAHALIRKPRAAARRATDKLRGGVRRWQRWRQRARVEAILAWRQATDTRDSEAAFAQLQELPGLRLDYGNDALSRWRRGVQRAPLLRALLPADMGSPAVLEAGCGDGMTGVILSVAGCRVTLTDINDWRDPRAQPLAFIQSPLEQASGLPANAFDLIYSFNTFEHLADPAAALAQLVRACRPGGLIYLNFDPLYASPWGLHAYGPLRMPYPQFLFSEAFIEAQIQKLGIHIPALEEATLPPLNRWRIEQFRRLWTGSGCALVDQDQWERTEELGMVVQFPRAFAGRGLTYADLVTAGMCVLLRKPAADGAAAAAGAAKPHVQTAVTR